MKILVLVAITMTLFLLAGCSGEKNEIQDVQYYQTRDTGRCYRVEIRTEQDTYQEIECNEVPNGYDLLEKSTYPPREDGRERRRR